MLKIGFIVDNDKNVPAHYAETIRAVAEKGHEVYFLRRQRQEAKKEKPPLLFRLFQAFEAWWFRPEFDALKPVSLAQWASAKNTFHPDGETAASPNAGAKAISLDVLYGLAFHPGEVVDYSGLAAYGIWFVEFGAESTQKDTVAFWEVMKDKPVAESRLLACRNGKRFLLYEGSTRTVPYSVKNTVNALQWKTASYLPYRLSQLEAEGEDFFSPDKAANSATVKAPMPGNTRMAFLFIRNLIGYAAYKRRSRREGPFTLLYSDQKFTPDGFARARFSALKPSGKDRFYADPFVLEKDGINYVFFEEMDEAKGKAHISVITIANGNAGAPQTVLEKPYHLSYSFVFWHEGECYMVPETAQNKTVELYKAKRFPNEWQFVMNLMENVSLFDATLHFENGKWWLFAAGANHPADSTNDQLFLFYSEELLSTHWTPHPQNPVATHAGNCRPAGRLFRYNGRLYRPAQNNASQQYGYGLVLNEIEVLRETEYKEKEALSVAPETLGLKACHHLDFSPSLVVIDGILATT